MCGPGYAPDIMVNNTLADDVTGEAELPGAVAVFDLGDVEHIVCGWRTNLFNCRHAKKGTRPNHAVTFDGFPVAREGHEFEPRPRETDWLLFDLA